MGTIIVTDNPSVIEFLDQFVETNLDYSDEKFDNYWCINIKPFICNGCGHIIAYAQCGDHFIIIWEKKDDDNLIDIAANLQVNSDYDPHVVRYKRFLGPCIEYYAAIELGLLGSISHGT